MSCPACFPLIATSVRFIYEYGQTTAISASARGNRSQSSATTHGRDYISHPFVPYSQGTRDCPIAEVPVTCQPGRASRWRTSRIRALCQVLRPTFPKSLSTQTRARQQHNISTKMANGYSPSSSLQRRKHELIPSLAGAFSSASSSSSSSASRPGSRRQRGRTARQSPPHALLLHPTSTVPLPHLYRPSARLATSALPPHRQPPPTLRYLGNLRPVC